MSTSLRPAIDPKHDFATPEADTPEYTAMLVDVRNAGLDVIANLERQIQRLESLPSTGDEQAQFLTMWEIAIVTLACEVGNAALTLSATPDLRATRILNRSLVEYGYRLHYYARHPDHAKAHGEQFQNWMRAVMGPWKDYRGKLTKAEHKAYRDFANNGSKEYDYPKFALMMKAMLKNEGLRGGDLRRAARALEVEYSVGSALAHASVGVIADVFVRGKEGGVERAQRSSHFYSAESMVRTTFALQTCLRALEYRHERDFGSGMHRRALRLAARHFPQSYSIFTFIPWNLDGEHG
jgi:hypothetical protein